MILDEFINRKKSLNNTTKENDVQRRIEISKISIIKIKIFGKTVKQQKEMVRVTNVLDKYYKDKKVIYTTNEKIISYNK